MIRAVFFDLGGTLLVMRRDAILQRVLRDEGYRVDLKRIHTSYMEMESSWLERYSARFAKESDATDAYKALDAMVIERLSVVKGVAEIARISALIRRRWEELGKEIPPRLYPDVEPVLAKLASLGLTLGLVSNAPPETTKTVEELGLKRYIRHIVISGVVGYTKPNPEIFRIALSKASASPRETIHVGDVYASDVVGARNAGITGVLLDRDRVAGTTDCPTIHGLAEVIPLVGSASNG
ncbi:MAG: HAD family hydrolase [Nitrososphaerales archaeon]|nr:HAD family hydrolase [Nitrososphaerales archaeon]